MQTMTFHASTDTTSETARHVLILMTHTTADGNHVTSSSVFRIYRSQNVIEQCPFFILRILDVGLERKKRSRHFEHVVDVATLVRPAIDSFRQLIRRTEIFVFAVSARSVTMIVDHDIPKVLSGNSVAVVAGVQILFQHAQHLRHIRVTVLSGQLVFSTLEWIHKSVMIEVM